MVGVSTAIILDLRRPLKEGTFPVRLRITFKRKQKYYLTDYSLTPIDFAKTQTDKARGKYKDLQTSFQAIEQKALLTIDKLPDFSFEAFEKKFLNKSARDEVFATYQEQIDKLLSEGQTGTAEMYNCARNSLLSFSKNKNLLFVSVNQDFLRKYEKWMVDQKKSLTSVSMYVRTLRTLFNDVIATSDLSLENYPFGKRKYQVPAARNVKKALALADIEKLFTYEPKSNAEAKARDLWIFSYLCNGINIKDLARLKYKQINKENISFVRAKTERTSRKDLKTIVAILTPELKEIIEKWGNKPIFQDSHVFPILKPELSPEQELATVKQATKTINKYIKRIAATVGIEGNISTYTARHSYATVLKRAGAPMEFISEALGHSDLRTTESYLDSFEDNLKKQYTSQLTAFKK